MVTDEYKKIRKMIQQPCKAVWCVPYTVDYYSEVVKAWCYYKRTGQIRSSANIGKVDIERIFDFHLHGEDHILLYYSINQRDCLWMCKVDDKYINILVPALTLETKQNSIIATYAMPCHVYTKL